MTSFNRTTYIRTTEGKWRCEFYAKGGEGTLAPLAPYGLDDSVGLTVNNETARILSRLILRGEVRLTPIKTWDGVVAW